MGLWSSIKSGLSKVGHAIGSAFQSAKSAVSSIAHSTGSAISTVYSDAKTGVTSYAKGVSAIGNKVVDDVVGSKGIINNTVGSVTGILSTPLLLLGLGVAGFLIFSGKNSSANVSYSR
jgi:phage-related protein